MAIIERRRELLGGLHVWGKYKVNTTADEIQVGSKLYNCSYSTNVETATPIYNTDLTYSYSDIIVTRTSSLTVDSTIYNLDNGIYKSDSTYRWYLYGKGGGSTSMQLSMYKYKLNSVTQSKGDYIEDVYDKNISAYPVDGVQDGYWYVLIR